MRLPEAVLVDARNFDTVAPRIISEVQEAGLIGFDIETHDRDRHNGLNQYMKVDEDGFSGNDKLIFDINRTTVVGFSLYPDKSNHVYYVNLSHADEENRVSWSRARTLLDAKKPDSSWVVHNGPFELVMMANSLGYDLDNVICTLQLAVSAYGPDEYDSSKFLITQWDGLQKLIGKIGRTFRGFDPRGPRDNMTAEQSELFAQVLAKESKAAHSYNGFVKSVSYGYGLKEAVKSWFNYNMTTFKDVLGDKPDMGALTGEDVAAYGCDDAFWCVQLFHKLLEYMFRTNSDVVTTYFEQELPMVKVYANVWRGGLRVKKEAIYERRDLERANMADVLRRMKAHVRAALPFKEQPHPKLMEREKWYAGNYERYRRLIETWAKSSDESDDFLQVQQVRGSVSNAWALEKKAREPMGPNLSHHMPVRTLLYDLLGLKLQFEKGKLTSNGEARGKLSELAQSETAREILSCLTEIAGIEQRMKLYLTPYLMLTDPDTDRMYPVLSSKLATRRMATQFPNPMQLAKQGTSTYIRGFFEADSDDHVIVSADWSSVELVEVGDFSGDPEFAKAFGQIPYEDLHSGATVDVLKIDHPELTEEIFKSLKRMSTEEAKATCAGILVDLFGRELTPSQAHKFWRTEIGKGSNFNYWYSGALSTVGQQLGWSPDKMWAATERYRERFKVAEEWRVKTINDGRRDGFIKLRDGHRRVRFELTHQWVEYMREKFRRYPDPGVANFVELMIKAVQSRAANQLVNAIIQGSCATLAKRSIIRMDEKIKEHGFDARFMIPIHDELLYSVHRDQVLRFIPVLRSVMTDHPDIIRTLPLHCTVAIGNNFEPFHPKDAPFGQIELDEAPYVDWLPEEYRGGVLGEDQIRLVLEYLANE